MRWNVNINYATMGLVKLFEDPSFSQLSNRIKQRKIMELKDLRQKKYHSGRPPLNKTTVKPKSRKRRTSGSSKGKALKFQKLVWLMFPIFFVYSEFTFMSFFAHLLSDIFVLQVLSNHTLNFLLLRGIQQNKKHWNFGMMTGAKEFVSLIAHNFESTPWMSKLESVRPYWAFINWCIELSNPDLVMN